MSWQELLALAWLLLCERADADDRAYRQAALAASGEWPVDAPFRDGLRRWLDGDPDTSSEAEIMAELRQFHAQVESGMV